MSSVQMAHLTEAELLEDVADRSAPRFSELVAVTAARKTAVKRVDLL